jgi:hypothetical protein
MKKVLKYGFIIILISIFAACKFVPRNQGLLFENGDFSANVVVIDKTEKQSEMTISEFNIEAGWSQYWSDDLIGNFNFVHIKTEDGIEGIFIIDNELNETLLPYDIMTLGDYNKKLTAEEENLSYEIIIRIVNDKFETKYDSKKFNVLTFYSYDENYELNKEKYMQEYYYTEK